MRISTIMMVTTFLSVGACHLSTGDQNSDVNIAGGEETTGYTGVIRFLSDEKTGRFCTGVVVSDSTALIAGHCVTSLTAESYIYAEILNGSKTPIKSDKVYLWLKLGNSHRLNSETLSRDLAVVSFKQAPFKNYDKIALSPGVLSGKPKSENASVTLVGYGANALGDTKGARNSLGVKRVGKNSIYKAEGGYYQIRSEVASIGAEQAIGASGDAGAPLLDDQGQLLGIGAGILLTDEDDKPTKVIKDEFDYELYDSTNAKYAYNAFVDLSSEASRKLLRYAAWEGRPEVGGQVVIPGITATGPVTLSGDDEAYASLSKDLPQGEWLSMVGGGGIFREQTSLALQSFSSASCSNGNNQQNSQQSGNGFASASAICGSSPSSGPVAMPSFPSPASGFQGQPVGSQFNNSFARPAPTFNPQAQQRLGPPPGWSPFAQGAGWSSPGQPAAYAPAQSQSGQGWGNFGGPMGPMMFQQGPWGQGFNAGGVSINQGGACQQIGPIRQCGY